MFRRFLNRGSSPEAHNNDDSADDTTLSSAQGGGCRRTPEEHIMRASQLIGGSGVSLDGQSLVVPRSGQYEGNFTDSDCDDMSSLNTTSIYDGLAAPSGTSMRILGSTASDSDYDTESNTYGQDFAPTDYDAETLANDTLPPLSVVEQSSSPTRRGTSSHAANHLYKTHNDDSTNPSTDDSDNHPVQPNEPEKRRCVPLWLIRAPYWLKLAIVVATALLTAAIVFVGVSTWWVVSNDDSGDHPQKVHIYDDPKLPPSAYDYYQPEDPPISAPVVSPPVDEDATAAPVTPTNRPQRTQRPTPSPTISPTKAPVAETEAPVAVTNTLSPTKATLAPTSSPTSSPSSAQTSAPTQGTFTFYVTAGRFIDDALEALPEQLPTLPTDDPNSMLVHLGDWNSPAATSCVEQTYMQIDDIYRTSSLPVYFVVGDNEYNDCPNPELALDYWYQYNLDFETKYWPAPQAWQVQRQLPGHAKNFAFHHDQMLFLGVSVVGGRLHDAQEWESRLAANLQWIDFQVTSHANKISTLVVFAHSDPDLESNDPFFTPFLQRVEQDYAGLEVIYVHRNSAGSVLGLESSYSGISNLSVVVVQGSVWPPLKMEINPYSNTVNVEQSNWYNQYIRQKNRNGNKNNKM